MGNYGVNLHMLMEVCFDCVLLFTLWWAMYTNLEEIAHKKSTLLSYKKMMYNW